MFLRIYFLIDICVFWEDILSLFVETAMEVQTFESIHLYPGKPASELGLHLKTLRYLLLLGNIDKENCR